MAFKIDPETAEVFLDATGSDPIPHIIAGIPVHLRDIRAYTDRPEFVLNPTDCTRTSTASMLLGSGLDFASEADDKAVTPILSEPLEGPVFLRSSEHQLPDLVAALHNGEIDIVLVGRVDSVNGGIRNTFEVVPDAPVNSFTLTMQGGGKGLLVNSTNLCKGTHWAKADFTGHNGKVKNFRPALQAKCPKGHRRGKRKRR